MATDRRSFLATGLALAAAPLVASTRGTPARSFPRGFVWGAATAGHQTEGSNTNSDVWVLEHVTPTLYVEPSGDAVNGFELWARDLDLVKFIGLNAYRFSLEWARIEPEPGQFSIVMLDHYKRIIDGCHARGLRPLVTFNHFTTPRWFAARGGWVDGGAADLFARFCERAARHLAGGVSHAMTLNEPNLTRLLRRLLPPELFDAQRAMLAAAARAVGGASFSASNAVNTEDIDAMTSHLIAGHQAARAAIKSVRSDLPVGVTLAMFDDQASGGTAVRDSIRAELYGKWLAAVQQDDFLGVQNYERAVWGEQGRLPPPRGATIGDTGSEIYAPSLAGAVRYAHAVTRLPIMVTEHGVGTADDLIRAALIPAALRDLKGAIDEGVPVLGYVHWSLVDNFEWIWGFKPRFGLCSVDRTTFRRTAKKSAHVLGDIARHNALA